MAATPKSVTALQRGGGRSSFSALPAFMSAGSLGEWTQNISTNPEDPSTPEEFGPGGPGGYAGNIVNPGHNPGGVLTPPGYTKPWGGEYGGDTLDTGGDMEVDDTIWDDYIPPVQEDPAEFGPGGPGGYVNPGTAATLGGAIREGLTYGSSAPTLFEGRGLSLCDPMDPNCYGKR